LKHDKEWLLNNIDKSLEQIIPCWVETSKRLPERHQQVNIKIARIQPVQTARYLGCGRFITGLGPCKYFAAESVQYWMPIADLPSSKEVS